MVMRIWKGFSVVLALVLASLMAAPAAAAESGPPPLAAQAAILVDGTTGQILYGRDIRGEFYPASITKIMTAYLAITHGWNRTVVVSPQAAAQQGSSAYLRTGQRLPMPKVVTAMMLVSGNDAAYAVAQTVAGSVPAFVRMMNAQAKAWGAPGIHFVNPNGLPNRGHVVSALGMAIIAEHAMNNPTFARIVDTRKSQLPPDPHLRIYYNQNQLLYNYPGAVGIKIGYTIEADETIVAAARRHGVLLIEVLLHDTPAGLWPDAANLLSWGFDHYHSVILVQRGQRLGHVIIGGRTVAVTAAASVPRLVADGGAARTTFRLAASHPRSKRLIRAGQEVGTAAVVFNHHTVGSVPLLNLHRVAAPPPAVHRNWWWLALPALVGISLLRPPRLRTSRVLRQGGLNNV